MIHSLFLILLSLLQCAASGEPLVFDCKIEGRKGSDASTESVVCSIRQDGELAGTILLSAPSEADPIWDSVVVPAAVRAMQGDDVFLRLSCSVSPRIKDPEGRIVSTTGLKASDWRSLQAITVREISENQYLAITEKPLIP